MRNENLVTLALISYSKSQLGSENIRKIGFTGLTSEN